MIFRLLNQRLRAVNLLAVDRANDVAFLQTGVRRGRFRFHFVDARRFSGKDQQLSNAFPAKPAARFGLVGTHIDRATLTVSFELDRDRLAFASNHRPTNAVVHSQKPRHGLSVHFQNFVTGLQSDFCRRRFGHDVTNRGRHVRFTDRITHYPDDRSEHDRQEKTEEWPCNRHDYFVERRNWRKRLTIDIGFPFDDIHRRQLRQRHKSAEWQRAQRILDTADFFLPKRLAEPDREFLDVETAQARRKKMPNLMHHNQQIENDQDLDEDEDDATNVKNH